MKYWLDAFLGAYICFHFPDIQGFKTEDEMVDFLIFANKTVNNTAHYLGGIVFNSKTKGNQFVEQISYKIRLSSFPRHGSGTNKLNPAKQDKEWFTEFMFPLYQVIGPRDKASRCGSVPGKFLLFLDPQACSVLMQRYLTLVLSDLF